MKKLFTLAAVMFAAVSMFAATTSMIRVDEWDQTNLQKVNDSIIATFSRNDVTVLALDTKDTKNKYNQFVAIEDNKDGWTWTSADDESDTFTFNSRLKMRGKSTKDARQIIIPVKKNDVVEIFAQSGNKDDERTFEVAQTQWDGSAKGTEFKNVLNTKLSKFDYTAAADGNIYIWCPGKEVNFFAFRITSDSETGMENTEAAIKSVKVVENGQLFIIKNGVKYNATGAIVK